MLKVGASTVVQQANPPHPSDGIPYPAAPLPIQLLFIAWKGTRMKKLLAPARLNSGCGGHRMSELMDRRSFSLTLLLYVNLPF